MSLYGSIKEVQSTIEKLYLKLEQRFNENNLIMELWNQMAQDVSQQVLSLHELPKSFWTQLQKDQNGLMKTITNEIKPQSIDIEKDISLSECIEKAIQSEEAIILKIYVPIIRNLRKNWTGHSLDFYIMVKAHIVRIKRAAEAFSGDPVVLQHSTFLFQEFEKEIQEPEVEINQKIKPARKSRTIRGRKTEKPKAKPSKKKKPKVKPKAQARAMPKVRAPEKKKPKVRPKAKAAAKPKIKALEKKKPKVRPKAKAAAKPKVKVASKKKKTTKQTPSPLSRSKMRRSRAKPLVEKADLRRRRARR